VCITTYEPDTKSNANPDPNPNPITKQQAIVNIKPNIVACCCAVCATLGCNCHTAFRNNDVCFLRVNWWSRHLAVGCSRCFCVRRAVTVVGSRYARPLSSQFTNFNTASASDRSRRAVEGDIFVQSLNAVMRLVIQLACISLLLAVGLYNSIALRFVVLTSHCTPIYYLCTNNNTETLICKLQSWCQTLRHKQTKLDVRLFVCLSVCLRCVCQGRTSYRWTKHEAY